LSRKKDYLGWAGIAEAAVLVLGADITLARCTIARTMAERNKGGGQQHSPDR
jgi:hypothetical protein